MGRNELSESSGDAGGWRLKENETSSMSTDETRRIASESFQEWIEDIREYGMSFHGAFFVCDPAGQVLERYICPDPESPIATLLETGRRWLEEEIGPNAVQLSIRSQTFSEMRHSDHTDPGLADYDSLAMPVKAANGKPLAIFAVLIRSGSIPASGLFLKNAVLAYRSRLLMNMERNVNRHLTSRHRMFEREARQKETLFQVARKFHSCNDPGDVLSELMGILHQYFPNLLVELYLSQDFHHPNFPVKPLLLNQNEDDLCTRAFITGKMMTDPPRKTGNRSIAVPLCGKQAVYGVFKLCADREWFDEIDTPFLSMLADSAGIAFENARLFEQSNVLIEELRLINDMTSQLNQSLHISDVLNDASKELIRILGAEYGCILKFDHDQNRLIVQSGNIPEMIRESFPNDYGFSGMVMRSREPIIVSDYLQDRKVNSKLMEITGSRSLIASPIVVQGEAIGAILLTHRQPKSFTYENYRLLQLLSGHIGLAMTNATLHDEVRRLAITDRLTELYNRHHLTEQIRKMQTNDECGSLILADIDHFKQINDTYGHQVGDETLRQVSRLIRNNLREEDVAARWGGEELAVYLPRAQIEEASQIAEQMRLQVQADTDPEVTVSIGVSTWANTDARVSVEHLFYLADMALYRAKRSGRNRIVIA